MNRKKFFRNLLGATAAVTIGKYLPVPKEMAKVIRQYPLTPAECLPPVWKMFLPPGTFGYGSLIRNSAGKIYFVERPDANNVQRCLNVDDLNDVGEIHEGYIPEAQELHLIARAIKEDVYEPDKERQPY